MPSTWSNSEPRLSTRSAAASSSGPWDDGAAKAIRSTASRPSSGAGAENLTDKQLDRLTTAIEKDEAHQEVYIAWRCAQDLRAAYRTADLAQGKQRAEKVLAAFHTCPIPEVARLGRTLRRWHNAFLAYFTTQRSSNGGTEAINGIIELHRRLARGYRNRDNYRLRMLLAAGGLIP
jgi:transposase